METVSLLIPCYNEQESLSFLYAEINKLTSKLSGYNFELIFVDDGSKDLTLKIIKQYAASDSRVKYLSFSRNFGKEAAIYAGLSHCGGDYTALLDADLQDPPELIEQMLESIKTEDYDCIAARRTTRAGEPPIRSFFANLFYRLINKLSNIEIVNGARDFRLMKRDVVNSIVSMNEYNRFSKGLFGWVGYKTKWISYENVERVAGQTKWSFWKLFLYSIDGITAFSTVPLAFASVIGVLFFLIAVISIIFIIIRTSIWGDPVAGWPALVCIILFVSSIQLLCLGIIGQYLAKTYLESKKRPVYLLRETNIESN
ncbi:MAG: glycosyltransferase family 2 protein [Clostridiales bacterium]|jgi:glycosyltransferase involved in cell wall biosynthesis|nr:glycosyltransferase family 2 protein [Clostridiales bacterium]